MLAPAVRWAAATVVLAALTMGGGCGADEDMELKVFAAASLRDAFEEITQAFETSHSNTQVVLNFAGSQVLRAQIERGAQADVFASANEAHASALWQAGLLRSQPRVFTQNELVLAIPADNPSNITSLDDIGAPSVHVVMGVPNVPVGRYARETLTKHAEATRQPGFSQTVLDGVDSFETNVRLIAAKLELGAADAGLIYHTDVLAAGGALSEVPLLPEASTWAPYPMAVTTSAQSPGAAQAFADFVLSPTGQQILIAHGFRPVA